MRAATAPGTDAGGADDARHAGAVLVQVLLAHQAVLAHGEAVVGGVDHDGVFRPPGLGEGVEHPPDPRVQVGDHAVVVGHVPAHHLRRAGPRGQQLVAVAQLAVVEGVLRQVAGGQGQLLRRVERRVFRRRGARIVGRGEGQVEEEGARAVVGAQELDGRTAEELGGVAVAQVAGGGAVLPAGIEVEEGHPVVVAHPADEDAVPAGEAALEAPGVVVPLAHVVGVVAGPAELLGEGGHGGVDGAQPGGVAEVLAGQGAERIGAGHQAGPGGDADAAGEAAEVVGAVEGDALGHQLVDPGRAHHVVAEGADRRVAVIVRDHQQDVRLAVRLAVRPAAHGTLPSSCPRRFVMTL